MDKSWKIENIPVPEVKLTAKLDKQTGILELWTEIKGIITKEIAELNSKAIRESLIEMGWTPPND